MRQVRTVADLGAVVRAARRDNKWTQAGLAQRAGVSRQWVVALESGQSARAELGRILAVLAALDLPMSFPAPDRGEHRAAAPPPAQDDEPWFDLNSHLASFTTDAPEPIDTP